MISKDIIATQQLSPVVETIFRWRADDPSHCLLRIFIDDLNKQAYVIASEPYSNDLMENHVSTDFGALALAAVDHYFAQLDVSRIKSIAWIAHNGRFSETPSYDNLHMRERFSRVSLPWPLPETLPALGGKWELLASPEEQELTTKLKLDAVLDIMLRVSGE